MATRATACQAAARDADRAEAQAWSISNGRLWRTGAALANHRQCLNAGIAGLRMTSL